MIRERCNVNSNVGMVLKLSACLILACFTMPCHIRHEAVWNVGLGLSSNDNDERLRLTHFHHRFQVQNASFMYTLAVCSGVEDPGNLASIIRTRIDNKTVEVLGRRNDTELIGGGNNVLKCYLYE